MHKLSGIAMTVLCAWGGLFFSVQSQAQSQSNDCGATVIRTGLKTFQEGRSKVRVAFRIYASSCEHSSCIGLGGIYITHNGNRGKSLFSFGLTGQKSISIERYAIGQVDEGDYTVDLEIKSCSIEPLIKRSSPDQDRNDDPVEIWSDLKGVKFYEDMGDSRVGNAESFIQGIIDNPDDPKHQADSRTFAKKFLQDAIDFYETALDLYSKLKGNLDRSFKERVQSKLDKARARLKTIP